MLETRRFPALLLVALLPISFAFAKNIQENTYETPQRLFHIARSANKNLVCYDVNLLNGKLNTLNPMKVYWVNREECPGKTNGLSYIQRKFAYGYKVVSTTPHSSNCTLTAYPKRQLTVVRQGSEYVCLIPINNQTAILRSLFVKAHPRNPLKVEYVELQGISLETHQPIKEKVYNE